MVGSAHGASRLPMKSAIAVLAAAACAAGLLFTRWVSFPLTNQLRGIGFSLAGHSVVAHRYGLVASAGVWAALLVAAMALALLRQRWRIMAWCAIGLLWLSSATLLLVALGDPALLKELALEANQAQAAAYF